MASCMAAFLASGNVLAWRRASESFQVAAMFFAAKHLLDVGLAKLSSEPLVLLS